MNFKLKKKTWKCSVSGGNLSIGTTHIYIQEKCSESSMRCFCHPTSHITQGGEQRNGKRESRLPGLSSKHRQDPEGGGGRGDAKCPRPERLRRHRDQERLGFSSGFYAGEFFANGFSEIQFTHVRCTIQWLLVYSESRETIVRTGLRTFPPVSSHPDTPVLATRAGSWLTDRMQSHNTQSWVTRFFHSLMFSKFIHAAAHTSLAFTSLFSAVSWQAAGWFPLGGRWAPRRVNNHVRVCARAQDGSRHPHFSTK